MYAYFLSERSISLVTTFFSTYLKKPLRRPPDFLASLFFLAPFFFPSSLNTSLVDDLAELAGSRPSDPPSLPSSSTGETKKYV